MTAIAWALWSAPPPTAPPPLRSATAERSAGQFPVRLPDAPKLLSARERTLVLVPYWPGTATPKFRLGTLLAVVDLPEGRFLFVRLSGSENPGWHPEKIVVKAFWETSAT